MFATPDTFPKLERGNSSKFGSLLGDELDSLFQSTEVELPSIDLLQQWNNTTHHHHQTPKSIWSSETPVIRSLSNAGKHAITKNMVMVTQTPADFSRLASLESLSGDLDHLIREYEQSTGEPLDSEELGHLHSAFRLSDTMVAPTTFASS